MNKIILHGFIMLIAFASLFFVTNQVNWMSIFKVEKTTNKIEEKLGDIYWKLFQNNQEVIKNKEVTEPIAKLLKNICAANEINESSIKLHILSSNEINAYTLPDNHIVIYTGLITYCETQDELCGVMSHELAHAKLNHVMKKLIKEVGLSILISITTGNKGGEIITETAKLLSSNAFDRSLEKDADIKAVDYMINANINPEGLANFLYNLSELEIDTRLDFSWISSHPNSKERAAYIIEYANNKSKTITPVLDKYQWNKLQEEANNISEFDVSQ
jgi:predicted Zn-dependent protease